MNELVTAIPTGISAFSTTNIDTAVILLLFLAQVKATFRRRYIVVGQYLGFCTLVIDSFFTFISENPSKWADAFTR